MKLALLLLVVGCHTPNPSFCPDGTSASGACSDARSCFGTAPFQVCPSAAPAGPRTLNAIDTATSCDEVVELGCLILGTDVTIDHHVVVRGSQPLIVIATGTLTIESAGILDVAGSDATSGPGANLRCSSDAMPARSMGGNGGGGAGGSFGTRGTSGGNGGGGATGGQPASVATAAVLQSGCSGNAGADGMAGTAGTRGGGGGGVLLIAGVALDLVGTVTASGGGGGGGRAKKGGGGGGGSGGMIAISAPAIMTTPTAQLFANGGGGGAGGGNSSVDGIAGSASSDAFTAGAGGGTGNGAGGDGAVQTTPAQPGAMSSDGGGGGGGGVGQIHVVGGATLGTARVSPPPS